MSCNYINKEDYVGFNWNSQDYVEEELPDVRKIEKVGDSGAESLFCDDFSCRYDKNGLLRLTGLNDAQSSIRNIIEEMYVELNIKEKHRDSLIKEITDLSEKIDSLKFILEISERCQLESK